ncbi:Ig-like domain repeat protein, partial [Methanobrevibacter sp. OttesenSCG-928-K11]|nr:Ig-like domain repeat protein [Methanobrevibacter sp. OttesenSCG-928-K11]
KVLDGKGKPLEKQTVEININGIFYYKETDSDGIARLNITLNPDSYIATATWNKYSISNEIIVS